MKKNGRLQRMKDSAETVPLLAHTSHTLKGIMVFIVQTTKKCSNVISIGLIFDHQFNVILRLYPGNHFKAKLLIFAANILFPGNQPSIRSPSVADFKSCADMVALAPSRCREEREPMAAQHRVFSIFWVRQPFDKGLKLDESSPSTDLREMFVKSRIFTVDCIKSPTQTAGLWRFRRFPTKTFSKTRLTIELGLKFHNTNNTPQKMV